MRVFRQCFYCNQYSLELRQPDIKLSNSYKWEELYSDWIKNKFTQKCSFCHNSLSLHFAGIEETTKYAYEVYDEYIKFMDGIDLPKDIIIKVEENLPDLQGLFSYDKELGKFVVKINLTQAIYWLQFKPVLYHEFTHLLDSYDPLMGKEKQQPCHAKYFTEIHAKYIELMALLNFKNINEKRKVSLMNKVPYYNRFVTLHDYINKMTQTFEDKIIERCDKDVTFEDAVEITRCIMYFRGIIAFCKNYLDEESINLIPKGNKLEKLVREKFPEDSNEYFKLTNLLDTQLIDSLYSTNGDIIDDIVFKMMVLLLINTPQYRMHKEEFKEQIQQYEIRGIN